MKKGILFALLFAVVASAASDAPVWSVKKLKQTAGVAWCEGPIAAVKTPLACSGDVNGLATPYDLLHAKWRLQSSVKGKHGLIFIFTK